MGGTERVYEYDLDGNVIGNGVYSPALGTTVENSSYTYNAAAQMIAAEKTVSGQVAANKSFGYDGRGMRVMAASGGGQTHYVYAKSGTFIGEYAGAPAEGKENVYLGTQLVATVSINVAPVASAGPDKQILTYQQASLDGSASTDPDGAILSYRWVQLAGPAGQLLNAATNKATYVAPTSGPGGTAVFRLTVTDDSGESSSDDVNVVVVSRPVANAGPDLTVIGGTLVTLNGSGSGGVGPLNFEWSCVALKLNNRFSATTTSIAPVDWTHNTYSCGLKVSDSGSEGLGFDSVNVRIVSPTFDSDGDGLLDAWEFTNFGSWTLYDANSDPDGDGITNLQEYAGGTSPTEAATTPPEAVRSVTGRPGVTANMIEWTAATNASSYKVYWGTAPNFNPAGAPFMNETRSPAFHKNLEKGTTYYYKVVAVNSLGESAASPEAALTPNEGVWQGPATHPGEVVASNVYGRKIAFWVDSAGGVYRVNAQRYEPESGWGEPEVIQTTGKAPDSTKMKAAMNSKGDIVVVWIEPDAYNVTDLKGISYSSVSKRWRPTWYISLDDGNPPYSRARGVEEIGDLVLTDRWAAVVWMQHYFDNDSSAERHIYGSLLSTNTNMTWGYPIRLDAHSSDLCGWSATPQMDMNDAGDTVFGWYRCGRNTIRSYIRGKGLQPPLQLQGTYTWSNTAFDIAVNTAQGRAVAVAPEVNGSLYGWELDLATNTLSGPELVRHPKGAAISSDAHVHLADDGSKYFAWTEKGNLYALARTAAGDDVNRVDRAGRTEALLDIQSLLGVDQTHVLSWRSSVDGTVYVSRYEPGARRWKTQVVNEGNPASRQCTITDGLGYIDTVTGSVMNSFVAPTP